MALAWYHEQDKPTLSNASGITGKKHLLITETLTGEVCLELDNFCKSVVKKYFVTLKVNLTTISFDKQVKKGVKSCVEVGNLSRISVFQVQMEDVE